MQRLAKNQTFYDKERLNPVVAVGAYCLMPNHFHLLVTQIEERGISIFIQKLSTAYSMYFNKKYKRTGGLFEGKFKSQHTNTDRYLKYIFSYIHLNPVKLVQKDWKERGIKDSQRTLEQLNTYTYSSYFDYAGKKRVQGKILNVELFPKYFPNKTLFYKEIVQWLSYNDSNPIPPGKA